MVVKQFGFFMGTEAARGFCFSAPFQTGSDFSEILLKGTLVVWNYINVMVILPAALLVLEQLGFSAQVGVAISFPTPSREQD